MYLILLMQCTYSVCVNEAIQSSSRIETTYSDAYNIYIKKKFYTKIKFRTNKSLVCLKPLKYLFSNEVKFTFFHMLWNSHVASSTWGLYCKHVWILQWLIAKTSWCFHIIPSLSMDLSRFIMHAKSALDMGSVSPGGRNIRKTVSWQKNMEKMMQTDRVFPP